MGFIPYYIGWHYTRAIREGWRGWITGCWFWFHLFPVGLHLRSLFSRFERIGEPYPDGFRPDRIASAFFINTMMRIVGALLRLVLVMLSIVLAALTLIAAGAWMVVWLLLPLLVPGLPVAGVFLVIVSI